MEEVAAAAETSPASLYRYFRTKENLVIWDEDDGPFLQRLDRALETKPPFDAFAAAIAEALEAGSQHGMEARTGRLELIFKEQPLLSARRKESRAFGHELAKAFARARAADAPSMKDLSMGAAAAAVLDVARETWVEKKGEASIASLRDEAFACLR